MGFLSLGPLEEVPMTRRPTYEELEQRVKELEKAAEKYLVKPVVFLVIN